MTSPSSPSGHDSHAADRSTSGRALVLAGGGAAGNAWEIGLIAGLFDAGVDLTTADLIVGTSAGATVAAQITAGMTPAELYAAILAETAPRRPDTGAGGRRSPLITATTYLDWSEAIIASSADAADMRRRMGKAALDRSASEGVARMPWRDVVAARLSSTHWPDRRLIVTTVDARTGEPVLLDRGSGIDLVDAVAASTSNGFAGAHQVGRHRLIDGGYRRNENADLAAGHARVAVLSPFGGRSRMPASWRMDLASQVDDLRRGASTVETVFPDASAGDVFNAAAIDPATRPRAARAGYDQGRALAGRFERFWLGRVPG